MIVGYFAWVRDDRGALWPEKYDAVRFSMNPEAKKFYEERTAGSPVPLNADEWQHSLSFLAARYPAPKGPEAR